MAGEAAKKMYNSLFNKNRKFLITAKEKVKSFTGVFPPLLIIVFMHNLRWTNSRKHLFATLVQPTVHEKQEELSIIVYILGSFSALLGQYEDTAYTLGQLGSMCLNYFDFCKFWHAKQVKKDKITILKVYWVHMLILAKQYIFSIQNRNR